MLEMDICQAMDNIHIITQNIYMIFFIMVYPYLSHDSLPNIEQI